MRRPKESSSRFFWLRARPGHGTKCSMKLGNRIRWLRKQTGMSGREVGEAVGASRTWCYSVEHGARPRADLASRLAALFGVRIEWLVDGVGDWPRKDRLLAKMEENRT